MKLLPVALLLLLTFGLAEVSLRIFHTAAPAANCLDSSERERHRYQPNCRGNDSFATNEDGLRDRPREFFRGKKTVLVLGGNDLEGVGLPAEATLSRQLESQISPFQFLNGGLEGAGPTQLRIQAERYAPYYPLTAALLVISETDVARERLARAVVSKFNDQGIPVSLGQFDALLPLWLEIFSKSSLGSFRLISSLTELHLWQERKRLIHTQELQDGVLCEGIRNLSSLKLPVFTVVVPLAKDSKTNQRLSLPNDPLDFAQMLTCAQKHSREIWDLRSAWIKRAAPLEPGDGLSTEGARLVAEELRLPLGEALRQIKGKITQ